MRQPGRKSKIVCTIGPAVHSFEGISSLIRSGMDVARLNFSHGTHADHKQSIEWIRQASKELQIQVGILGDLQGPKIRTGKILDAVSGKETRSIPVSVGQQFYFVGTEIGASKIFGDGSKNKPISISYARLAGDLKKEDVLLFDDGLVRMKVDSVLKHEGLILASVVFGKSLGENKGVNMPGAKLSSSGVTEKDWDDVLFAVEHDVDFLALSFVRSSREVKSLAGYLEQKNTGIHIISKIEKGEALEAIDDILKFSDGIMVARGDLGVEIGNEKVAIVQKELIAKARQAGKPVITATQMLMSMVDNPTPSRAEASDVANAVLDGSDALMLSNETATGNHPNIAVETMAQIIIGAETLGRTISERKEIEVTQASQTSTMLVPEAIDLAAASLADNLDAKAITCLTRSGLSARLLAKHRPQVPIFAFTEDAKVRSQLCLSWGVNVIPWTEAQTQDYTIFDEIMKELDRLSLIKSNDKVVMTAGIPTSALAGTTNTVVVKSLK